MRTGAPCLFSGATRSEARRILPAVDPGRHERRSPRNGRCSARPAGDQKTCDDLKPGDQAACDLEKLSNPNTDSRNLQGSPDREVRTILAGIDIETPEILLADRLNEKGAGIDLVLAHHPEGRAFANFSEVTKMQADILNR